MNVSVEDYSYARKVTGSASVAEHLQNRVWSCVSGLEVEVIDGIILRLMEEQSWILFVPTMFTNNHLLSDF